MSRPGIDSTFTIAMITKNFGANLRHVTGINIEHKQIPKNILTDDENYHGTQYIKRVFDICLY